MRARERVSHALSTARGVRVEDDLREYRDIVRQIREVDLRELEDAALTRMAADARERARAGMDPDKQLVTVFALAAEACRRALGLTVFEEQLVAGIVLHRGRIAQMQTGEGKTLAAVFPASLSALSGRGVHVLTANDYLAARDARWMGPVYDLLGLRVASVSERTGAGERKAAYGADVTYLTAREAGFDYLRDGMRCDAGELVQRELSSAIVDEADFILIDEARIPLIIAGAVEADGVDLAAIDRLVRQLEPGTHYEAEREGRRVSLTLAGLQRVEQDLGMGGIHEERGARVFARVHAALHARCLLRRDVDYVVKSGRIEIVDGFTGRIADRRQWPWGIQAALEAREGIAPQAEGRAYGSITIQHFMGLYGKLAAMTATAVASAEELSDAYRLSTVIIPTVKPVRRVDKPDLVFRTREAKMRAVAAEVGELHRSGRPVLVGTASVEESEDLARLLSTGGVDCRLLNAKNDEREAELVAQAGRQGAVTISTNMAGRGTDIRLAGPDGERGRPSEHTELLRLGGLAVIGTNRHESRRVDDQLRGRAGRQGEPGSSQFFISLEDPLFERYGVREFLPPAVLAEAAPTDGPFGGALSGPGPGAPLPPQNPRVAREIGRAQSIIEAQNHSIRRTLRKYSLLVELDRRAVRRLRDEALRQGKLPAALEEACGSHAAEDGFRQQVIQAWLARLDAFWADHLQMAEEVREGIHLERLASRDPGLEYIRRVGDAFLQGLARAEEEVAEACRRTADGSGSLSPESMGVPRPSSTWTYQVDDESPVGFSLSAIGGTNIAAAIAAGIVQWLALISRWIGLAPRETRRRGGE